MEADGVHNEFSGAARFVIQARDVHGDIHIHAPNGDLSPVEAAATELAATALAHWRDEAATRGLFDPAPLPVEWVGEPGAADHAENIGAGTGESPGDVAELAEAFRGLSHPRLVLLGGPGSGKSTVAMLLVLQLLSRWQPGQPVPVLLPVDSWQPDRTHFRTWLRHAIEEHYPALTGAYGADVVSRLVRDRRVLPVLDGLDEMPAAAREVALPALNRALTDADAIVLTARTPEYRRVVRTSDVLRRAAVLRARPLAPETVVDHLRRCAPPARLPAWQPVFDELTRGAALTAALSTPLMVWLTRVRFSVPGTDPAELTDPDRFGDPATIEEHLLDGLVPAAFPDEPVPDDQPDRAPTWSSHRASRWLGFLADHLTHRETDRFRWWRLCREPVTRAVLAMLATVAVAVLLLVAWWLVTVVRAAEAGTAVSPASLIAFFFGAGVVLGVGLGTAAEGFARLVFRVRPGVPGRTGRPAPGVVLRRARWAFRRWPVLLVLVAGFVWLLLPGKSLTVLGGPATAGLLVTVGLAGTVRGVLLSPAEPGVSSTPERLLTGDRSGLFQSGAAVALIIAIVVAAFVGRGGAPAPLLGITGAGGWLGSVAVLTAASAWMRWQVARVVLATTGRLPWRLMTFLREARRRGVLRQDAGTYRFRHALVRERLIRGSARRHRSGAPEWDGEALRIRGSNRPSVRAGSVILPGLPLVGLALIVASVDAAALREVLNATALFAAGVLALLVLLAVLAPRKRADLRLDPRGISGGTSARRFHYEWDEITGVAVRQIVVSRRVPTGYYALHVRLRPGVAPPKDAAPGPEGWIPLWITGRSREIPPALSTALDRLAGSRWDPHEHGPGA